MTDLLVAIHAKLARGGCCEGYSHTGIDQMRSALTAVLDCHSRGDVECMGCGESWPCREVRFIAAALKVEVGREH